MGREFRDENDPIPVGGPIAEENIEPREPSAGPTPDTEEVNQPAGFPGDGEPLNPDDDSGEDDSGDPVDVEDDGEEDPDTIDDEEADESDADDTVEGGAV